MHVFGMEILHVFTKYIFKDAFSIDQNLLESARQVISFDTYHDTFIIFFSPKFHLRFHIQNVFFLKKRKKDFCRCTGGVLWYLV